MKAPLSKRKVLKPDPLKNTRSPCCCEHDPGIQSGDLVGNGGFYPGWFWSPLLAVMQFFGGMAIAAGVRAARAAVGSRGPGASRSLG